MTELMWFYMDDYLTLRWAVGDGEDTALCMFSKPDIWPPMY
jgi:hypothetical protein